MGAGADGQIVSGVVTLAGVSLFWRIFTLNAVVLVIALAPLVFTPATVSTPMLPAEAVVLLVGQVALLIVNAALLRVGLAHALTSGRPQFGRFGKRPGTRMR